MTGEFKAGEGAGSERQDKRSPGAVRGAPHAYGAPAPAATAGSGSGPSLLLDQAFDGDSLYQLRATVAAHAGRTGLSPARAGDLVVAVHELAANVIRHGGGRGRLLVWRHHDELHCRITDDGGVPPVANQPGGSGPGTLAGTKDSGVTGDGAGWRVQPGHGLWLVSRLADRVGRRAGQDGSATTITFGLRPTSRARFALARNTWPDGTIFAVSGHLDPNSAPELIEAADSLLAGTPAARLILDLAGLTIWDSFGLAALVRAQSHIDASPGARLVLAAVPQRLFGELRDTGLLGRFTIADSTEQAIADMSSPPR